MIYESYSELNDKGEIIRFLYEPLNATKTFVMDKDILQRSTAGYKINMIKRPTNGIWVEKCYHEVNNKGKTMFEDELNELETVYKKTLEDLESEQEMCLPYLLAYMEKFLSINKDIQEITVKLDELLRKQGREDE